MSFLFKFVGSSFLLTFGIILLVCGSMMLYSYRRLNLLERSMIEHGKILQNFIMNYNIQMQNINSMYIYKNKFESTDTEPIKKINLGEKIYVSEDECTDDDDDCCEVKSSINEYIATNDLDKNRSIHDDDDDDDDEDDDDDDDDDEDDDDEDDDEDEDDEDDDDDDDDDDDEDEKRIKETNDDNIDSNSVELLPITKDELEKNIKDLGDFEEIDLAKPTFSNTDDETFIKNLPINLDTFNIDLKTDSKIINLNNLENEADTTETNVTKKNYSKMKVDDLKTIAVTRNLLDNESAQKMKKADLIKILQKS
jgi:hypothetical protein